MTKIAVQTTKYETTRQKGVHSISQSENVNHADFALRIARLGRDSFVLVIDETEEGAEGLCVIVEQEDEEGCSIVVVVISTVEPAIVTTCEWEKGTKGD
jgi:3-dehydroquinate synthase class II